MIAQQAPCSPLSQISTLGAADDNALATTSHPDPHEGTLPLTDIYVGHCHTWHAIQADLRLTKTAAVGHNGCLPAAVPRRRPSARDAPSSPLLPTTMTTNSNHSTAVVDSRTLEEGSKLVSTSEGRRKLWEPPRLVSKSGDCLVRPIHQLGNTHQYYNNWFHLVIELSWRHIFALFSFGFVTSWLLFGLFYYIIVYLSDLSSDGLEGAPSIEQQPSCIANVRSFTSAFLFRQVARPLWPWRSIHYLGLESQHTIGYGTRYITEMCPPAFLVLCVQLVVGVLLQTLLAGIVIAKVLRPKKRKQEMRFSHDALIGPMDEAGTPALMIRIADVQHKLYLAESHVRLYMASTRTDRNGRKELVGLTDLNVGYDTGTDRVLLLWPVVVRHVIDEESPLYGFTPASMGRTDYELLMTIEGIVEATGMTFQARTSFLPGEIRWAHKFVPIVAASGKNGEFEADYELFDRSVHCPDFTLNAPKSPLLRHMQADYILRQPRSPLRQSAGSGNHDGDEEESNASGMRRRKSSLHLCGSYPGFT